MSGPFQPHDFGPFRLERRLAVGGTAEVFLAKPLERGEYPAQLIIKRLLPQLLVDHRAVELFEREAEIHRSVHHEHVVSVFGAGKIASGEPWLALEYIEGIDADRLLRQYRTERQILPVPMVAHLMSRVLRGLQEVHDARSADGAPLGLVHRDVTPSNIYLAMDGAVKLGDFGIAVESQSRTGSSTLKGKIGYLAPEQVAGESFDYRADLFSAASVLTEAVLGTPLFVGAGQLAILLAIRDARIDPLKQSKDRIDPVLYALLERSLARDPKNRFPTAVAMADALAAFDPNPESTRRKLALEVQRVRMARPSTDQIAAARESAKIRVPTPMLLEQAMGDRPTPAVVFLPSKVIKRGGEELGPWSYAKLVESIATGLVGRGDMVSFAARPVQPIEEIAELARFLPDEEVPSTRSKTLFASRTLVGLLGRIYDEKLSGLLVTVGGVEGQTDQVRKELTFVDGRLEQVVSSDAKELLGEYMVSRGLISRDELDMALAVLPRYGGRLGDTLIGLGLVSPVDVFRAIREQGRDRAAALFDWTRGEMYFDREFRAPRIPFALELNVADVLLHGFTRMKREIGNRDARGAQTLVFERPLQNDEWPTVVRSVADSIPSTWNALRGSVVTEAERAVLGNVVDMLISMGCLRWSANA